MSEESLSDRLTEEITALSTKLVTAVSKQLELEEKLLYYHRENHQLKTKVNELANIDNRYTEIELKYQDLSKNFSKISKERDAFDDQNKKLQLEVEELTASLFDEANKMVDNASRETYNFKIKNRKLYEEIDEKNLIIENLQNELVELKKMFEDEERKNKTKRISLNQTNSSKDVINSSITRHESVQEEEDENFFDSSIFSPKLKAIRFDLENYKDFKEFATHLINPTYNFDLTSLKLNKWFKKIWVEEIENSFTIPSTNLFNRWQKGKYFWNAIIEGKIKIEPLKNINDTIGEDIKNQGFSGPCDFCQEVRNEKLEYLRLHSLKLTHVELNEPVEYQLCNYCLIKIRNVCDFFAKLRLVNKNFYKLDLPDHTTEYKLIKIYLNLCLIRCKNFWGKIGYYDNVNEISQINIDEIDTNDFKLLLSNDCCSIHSTEGVKSFSEENKPSRASKEEILKDSDDSEKYEDTIDKDINGLESNNDTPLLAKATEQDNLESYEQEAAQVDNQGHREAEAIDKIGESTPEKEAEESSIINQVQQDKAGSASPKKKNKSKNNKKNKVAGLVGAFESAEPATEPATEPTTEPESTLSTEPEQHSATTASDEVPETIDLTMDESADEFTDSVDLEQTGLSRKKSKSKQFSKKINSGLDDTLKMLEESIQESK